MTHDQTLDVRTIPRATRPERISTTFRTLRPGAGFQLLNNRDPNLLYRRLLAEQPGAFTWDYLENGPDLWRVRIGRPGISEGTGAGSEVVIALPAGTAGAPDTGQSLVGAATARPTPTALECGLAPGSGAWTGNQWCDIMPELMIELM